MADLTDEEKLAKFRDELATFHTNLVKRTHDAETKAKEAVDKLQDEVRAHAADNERHSSDLAAVKTELISVYETLRKIIPVPASGVITSPPPATPPAA
jgi:hypothetical protein